MAAIPSLSIPGRLVQQYLERLLAKPCLDPHSQTHSAILYIGLRPNKLVIKKMEEKIWTMPDYLTHRMKLLKSMHTLQP